MARCKEDIKHVYRGMYPYVKSMPAPESLEDIWCFCIPVGGGHKVSVSVPPDSNKNAFAVVETLVYDAEGHARRDLPEELGYGSMMGVNYFSRDDDYITRLVQHVAALRDHFEWTQA